MLSLIASFKDKKVLLLISACWNLAGLVLIEIYETMCSNK